MIIDRLDQLPRYVALNPHFATAVAVLNRTNLSSLSTGRLEVDGLRVYAEIINGPGRERNAAPLETHDRYIDIHYLVEGNEEIGWTARSELRSPQPKANPDADVIFYDDEPETWVSLSPGTFAICFPEDGHAPMVSTTAIRKVVVKVCTA